MLPSARRHGSLKAHRDVSPSRNDQTPEPGTKCLGSDTERPPSRRDGRSHCQSQRYLSSKLSSCRFRNATYSQSSGPMVFDLILDVMNVFWQLGDAHTKSAITLLPTEVAQLSKSLMNPGR